MPVKKDDKCHLCEHFLFEDVREWPNGNCSKLGIVVNGLKVMYIRPRMVSSKRMCPNFSPHGRGCDDFPTSFREYSSKLYEWEYE